MSTYLPTDAAAATSRRPRPLPLNLFGIPFGLLGLADCWLVAAEFGLAPVTLGRVLVAIAVAAWLTVLFTHVVGMTANGVSLFADLRDPLAGPFSSLAVITPTLAAADALYPLNHTAGSVVVNVGVALIVVLAGWFTGQWIYAPLEFAKVHPGYFLPSVAGGLVAAASAALVGEHGIAEALFGFGLISWLVIGSIVLGRLIVGPPLPTPLIPTLAIEIAPAGVATFAAFVIDGQHIDTTVQLLAGYGVMMVIAQLRLLPAFVKLRFMPSFWAFTFAWAAVVFAGELWLGVGRPAGWKAESYVLLALISLFIGLIAVRTVFALARGTLLPAPPSIPSPAGLGAPMSTIPSDPPAAVHTCRDPGPLRLHQSNHQEQ